MPRHTERNRISTGTIRLRPMPTAWRCVTARTGSISMALTKSGALLEKVGIARYREMFTRLSGKSRERLIQSGIFSEKAK